ncbi:MAG: hypothetical protein AAF628_30370 [Planctomycetota bacterium]
MRRLLGAGLPFALLAAVVLAFYGSAIGHAWALDSLSFLQHDARIHGLRVGEILSTDYWHFAQSEARSAAARPGLYRPLTLLWLAGFYQCTGADELAQLRSPPIQASLILLHWAAAGLRYLLFHALLRGRPRARLWALVGALLLAVHPAATEAVVTPVGASEGLVAALGTASLLLYLRAQRRPSLGLWGAHGAALLLALLSKENAVAFVGATGLCAWLFGSGSAARRLATLAPALIALVVWIAARLMVLGQLTGVANVTLEAFPTVPRLATALAVIGDYDLGAIVWPAWLHPNLNLGDFAPAAHWLDPRALVGGALVAAAVIGLVLLVRRDRVAALGLGLAGGALLPSSNLVTLIGALGATRFLYVPLTGLALLVVVAALRLTAADRVVLRVAGCAFVAAGFATSLWFVPGEVRAWRSQEALMQATLVRYPGSAWASYNLAVSHHRAGRVRDALADFEVAAGATVPQVPGRAGEVVEDLLQTKYQSHIGAATCLQEQISALAPASVEAAPLSDRARSHFRAAAEAARTAAAQVGDRTSVRDWDLLAADALLAEAQVVLARAAVGDEEGRRRGLAETEAILDEAAASRETLRVRMGRLEVRELRGDAGAGAAWDRLFVTVRDQLGARPAAREVARAFASRLRRRRDLPAFVRVLRELYAASGEPSDGARLLRAGRQLLRGSSAKRQELGRQALRSVVEIGSPAQHAIVVDARRLLAERPQD